MIVLLSGLGLLLAMATWLFGTNAGARWAVARMAAWSAIEIAAGSIDGRLAGRLEIRDLALAWKGGRVRAGRLVSDLSAASLLGGEVQWLEIALEGVAIDLDAARTTAGSTGKKGVPEMLAGLSGWPDWRIESLRLAQVKASRDGQELFVVEQLHGSMAQISGELDVRLNELETTGFEVMAAVSLQPAAMVGQGEVTISPRPPWHGVQALSAHWRVSPAGPGQIKIMGNSTLNGDAGPLATLAADLKAGADGLTVEKALIRREGRPDRAEMTGRLGRETGELVWSAVATLDNVSLADLGVPLTINGSLTAAGMGSDYQGDFVLAGQNPEWSLSNLSGSFSGGAAAMTLTDLKGNILRGQLGGTANIAWGETAVAGLQLHLAGIDVNPLVPQVHSQLSGDLMADLAWRPDLRYDLRLKLLPSRWHDHSVAGNLTVTGRGDDFKIPSFELKGEGLTVHGAGALNDRFHFSLSATRLDDWWPGAAGRADASGWLRWRSGEPALEISGHLDNATLAGGHLDALNVQLAMPEGPHNIDLHLTGEGLQYRQYVFDRVDGVLSGAIDRHRATLGFGWDGGELAAVLNGGWQDGTWTGWLNELEMTEQVAGTLVLSRPANLQVARDRARIADLSLFSDLEEALSLNVDFVFTPLSGQGKLIWWDLDLSRLNHWLPVTFAGASDGEAEIVLSGDRPQLLRLLMSADFGATYGDLHLEQAEFGLDGLWNASGVRLDQHLDFSGGGQLALQASSPVAPRWGFPWPGRMAANWAGLPLSLVQDWLPDEIRLQGGWEGVADGTWDQQGTLDLNWVSQIDRGEMRWRQATGELTATGLEGFFDGEWTTTALAVDTGLNLADHGRMTSSIQLPLSNRYPYRFEPRSAWQGSLDLQVRESGLLSYALPGLIEDTHGKVELHAGLAGTPEVPILTGTVSLSEASGTLPSLGLRLDRIALNGSFGRDNLVIDTLEIAANGGHLDGSGSFRFEGWTLAEHAWRLKGENMPLVNLPELELLASPDLTGKGVGRKIDLTGRLNVPRLQLRSVTVPGQMPVSVSSDVVMVDAGHGAIRERPWQVNADVRLDLGDQVFINTAGVDARLTGGIDLVVRGLDRVTGSGQISVAKGTYAGHGVRLPIERGRLLFAGGPLASPTLDILALKKIEEVKVGVKITGTPRLPVVELYSEPAMADTDILAYIVLGRPFSQETGENDVLMLAAGALLSRGESAALQDSLQRRLGIDVIQVSAGNGDVSESVVTIGKYLQPDLYVSLGYSVFTQTNEVRIRYSLTDQWELQSNMGIESGADIFYRIDFDK